LVLRRSGVVARRSEADEQGEGSLRFAGGRVGRVLERAIENPAASGGLLVMALTAGAIAVNATFLQGAEHPRPNLAPRSQAHATTTPSAAIPTPRTREAAVEVAPIPPAALGPASASPGPAQKSAAQSATAPADPKLVADVQRELTRRGLYMGAIDGVAGSKTRAAIMAYQNFAGMVPSGVASADVLAALKRPTPLSPPPAQKAAPLPPAAIPAVAPMPPAVIPARPLATAPATATATAPIADPFPADTYRRVQVALNQAGYGPIPVDGRQGKDTADAIRRFELDYGLPITGQPDDAVIKRLAAIGALAAR
jgi:peptidoglycan hydrolase-like protein with peptidoglycan-binding domain